MSSYGHKWLFRTLNLPFPKILEILKSILCPQGSRDGRWVEFSYLLHCEQNSHSQQDQIHLSIKNHLSLSKWWLKVSKYCNKKSFWIIIFKFNLPHWLLMYINRVNGSPTWTGPVTRLPEVPYPVRISMWHSGGVRVKWTGSAVFTLKIMAQDGLKLKTDLLVRWFYLIEIFNELLNKNFNQMLINVLKSKEYWRREGIGQNRR